MLNFTQGYKGGQKVRGVQKAKFHTRILKPTETGRGSEVQIIIWPIRPTETGRVEYS